MSPDDGLPVFACQECCTQVDVSYAFRETCQQSDIQLRSYVEVDPPLEIMNAPDVKQEIEIVENGFDMDYPDESDMNTDDVCVNDANIHAEVDTNTEESNTITEESNLNGVNNINAEQVDVIDEVDESDDEDISNSDPLSVDPLASSAIQPKSMFEDSMSHEDTLTDEPNSQRLNGQQKQPRKQDLSQVIDSGVFLQHSGAERQLFHCFICTAKYVKRSYFANHLQLHLDKNILLGNEEADAETNQKLTDIINSLNAEENQERVATFRCDTCNVAYALEKNYWKHQKIVHSVDRPAPSETDDDDRDPIPEISHSEEVAMLKATIKIDAHWDLQMCSCNICKKTFPKLTELIHHNLDNHSTKKMSKCSFCKKNFFSLVPFMKHFKMHTLEKNFVCSMCGSTFVSAHHLKLHATVAHKRGCPVCGKPVKRKADMRAHIKTHNPPRPGEKRIRRKDRPETSGMSMMSQSFIPKMEEFSKSESDSDVNEPEASSSKKKRKSRISKTEGLLKTTNYFSQVYQTCLRKQYSLKVSPKHAHKKKKRKSEKDPNRVKSSKKSLNLSKNEIKKEMKEMSSRVYVPKEEMKPSRAAPYVHVEASPEKVAEGEKNLMDAKISGKNDCTFCGKQFKGISKLKRHILIHTGVRPFQCDICFRRFNQKPSMNMHVLNCHMKKKVIFQCRLCPKTFPQRRLLFQHMESHEKA